MSTYRFNPEDRNPKAYRERPVLRTRPGSDHRNEARMAKKVECPPAFHRPHMDEAMMAQRIVAFWQACGYHGIVAYADKGVIRSNLGRNVYPPKE